CLTVSSSTISGNQIDISGTVNTGGDTDSGNAVGGGIGMNGGFSNLELGTVGVTNTKITPNSRGSSVTGAGCQQDCRVNGGGIWFKWGKFDIRWSTIAANTVHRTASLGTARGGGISASTQNTSLSLRSTIVANNVADVVGTKNIEGALVPPTGYNLFDDNPVGTTGTDQINQQVCFEPLGNYGGLDATTPSPVFPPPTPASVCAPGPR